MSADDQAAFRFPQGVLAREVQGELVLLNLGTEQYYGLDQIGADIVTRLTRGPVDAALIALESTYSVDGAVLRTDVEALIEELVAAGLLEATDPR
ncbi:PqqD family protein [Blastococcus sp. SYSU D00813]